MKYKVKSEDNGELIEIICRNRGVDSNRIGYILNPDAQCVQTPNVYSNMQKAIETILMAIGMGKKICFVVDSDVDGFMSSAMLISYINRAFEYTNIIWILHENKEHGLTDYIMNHIQEEEADLIILPDAGSSDYKQHAILVEQGREVICIDHHEAEYFSKDAIVVNNQLDNFGNKTLCGGGMVMKVMEALDNLTGKDMAKDYMDLCATALVGDCMIMTVPETRYYVQEGLKDISNPLLYELYKADANRNFELISFDIAPTINAFIRVGTQEEKNDLFNALLGFNYEREISIRGKGSFELELPEYISALSGRIKSRQTSEVTKALEKSSEIIEENLPFTICFLGLEVNKNLTGLIGNRLVVKYNKPVIVVKNYGGSFKGSARSTDTFPNFKDYLSGLGYFDYCEGHQSAFGVGLKEDAMNKMMKDLLGHSIGEDSDVNLVDKAYIEKVSAFDIMSLDDFKNHWSRGFEKPQFYIKLSNIQPNEVDIIGQKKDTIRIKRDYITYIKFKCSEEELIEVQNGTSFDIEMIGNFAVNEWNDRMYPQVIIEKFETSNDVQPIETSHLNAFGNFTFGKSIW